MQIRNVRLVVSDALLVGREVLYMAYGYDGTKLVPITAPFILHKDSHIEYINKDTVNSASLDRWRNKTIINE